MLSSLFSVLHIFPLFSVDFVMAWWLTIRNELGFVDLSMVVGLGGVFVLISVD